MNDQIATEPAMAGLPAPEPVAPTTPPAVAVANDSPPAAQADTPWVLTAWKRMRREPSALFTVAYVFVSFLGLWANFWFYRDFGLPILEYMQPSDYLVAGLRDPAYAALLAVSIVLTVVISGPDIYRRHHPLRVAELRHRWWGRLLFPENRWFRWKGFGIAPETGVAIAVFLAVLWTSASYVQKRGELIQTGREGTSVSVTLAGAEAPLPQSARLLGTSSAFVFLWWPQTRVAEVIPIEGIARLQSVPASIKPVRDVQAAADVRADVPPPATTAPVGNSADSAGNSGNAGNAGR